MKEKKPDIVFIMETRIKSYKFDAIKRKLMYEGCFTVNLIGNKGGLSLL